MAYLLTVTTADAHAPLVTHAATVQSWTLTHCTRRTRSFLNQMFFSTSMSFFRFCSFCRASSLISRLCRRSSMDGDLQGGRW